MECLQSHFQSHFHCHYHLHLKQGNRKRGAQIIIRVSKLNMHHNWDHTSHFLWSWSLTANHSATLKMQSILTSPRVTDNDPPCLWTTNPDVLDHMTLPRLWHLIMTSLPLGHKSRRSNRANTINENLQELLIQNMVARESNRILFAGSLRLTFLWLSIDYCVCCYTV